MPIPVITTRLALSVCLFLFMGRAPFGILAENYGGVVAPEGEGIGKNGAQIDFSCTCGDIIQITLRIAFLIIDCGRYKTMKECQHGDDAFQCACGS